MRIAICDDEPVFLKRLYSKIRSKQVHDCQIEQFTSGRELLNNFVKGYFQAVILDVEMPELNGLETAEHIRRLDKDVILCFLTNYEEFAIKGYEVGAFRYMLKNQPEYMTEKQLTSIFDECTQRFKKYSFDNKTIRFAFDLYDILYFEGHRRRVIVYTANGEIEYSGIFSTVCTELEENNFILIARGILVNLEHIKGIRDESVLLSNGVKLPISRTYLDEVTQKYLKFVSRR